MNSNAQLLDLVFVLDATGSMGPWIRSAENSINSIVKSIHDSGKLASADALRVGVMAYRDIASEDFHEFTTKAFPLTSKINEVQNFLRHLGAIGGGDGPEAVATALNDATNDSPNHMGWYPSSKGAHQILVHITDAPPHGIEKGDTKSPIKDAATGGPFGKNILKTNSLLKTNGFTYFVVSCGEMGKAYDLAVPFYRRATSGNGYMLPLSRADLLPKAITALALESLALNTALEDMIKVLKPLSVGTKPSFANDDILPASMPSFHVLLHSIAMPEVMAAKELTSEELNHIMDAAETPEDLDTMTKAFRPSPEEAIDTMHALFTAKGTKVPTLKTTVDYSFTGKALHNWKIMESAKTPEDLVGAVSVPEGIPLTGSGSAQAVEVVHEPITKSQVERIAHRFKAVYGTSAF